MVVDDDEDIRDLMKYHLDKLGCKSILLGNGDDALEHYERVLASESAIDIAILDLSLDGSIGGLEIAEKIHAIDPSAKLIVSSGYTESDEMREYQKFGFAGALEKIFNREKIESLLLDVLS